MFGLTLDEVPEEIVEVWDINWKTFNLFHFLMTQWRVGGTGTATGLDYNAIPATGKMLGYKQKEINEMFPDIVLMENEAMITMGENRKDGNSDDC